MSRKPRIASDDVVVLHRDASVVAVAKPGGMLVHRTPLARGETVFLLQLVRDRVGRPVYAVHRLDRAASGVMLFALSSDDVHGWQEALRAEAAVKEYLALVRGICPEAWCVGRPLTADSGRKQEARTSFTRVAVLGRLSLVRARIHTGRRHQIRRHLSHCAHQIVGDSTYGKGRINRELRRAHGLPRLFLHAWRLRVRHPHTGHLLALRCPLAPDLRAFLQRWKRTVAEGGDVLGSSPDAYAPARDGGSLLFGG